MAELKVYGASWCPDCRRAKTFLGEHRVPYDWIDIESDADGLRYVEQLQGGGRTIPTIVFKDGEYLLEPSNEEIARKLGLSLEAECDFYDLAIVGGGPAGLAAAIYAAREGISAVVVDRGALGGQAGVTQRIDNYPGFPGGVGGAELAERFVTQARDYGVELLEAVAVDALGRDGTDALLRLSSGQSVGAHAVLVATGSTYRRLGVPGEDDLIGAGVHFCATCDGPFYRGAEELLVIGGGNSGLEEGLFLSQFADRIRIIDRNPQLKGSALLQEKIRSSAKIEVNLTTEIVELRGTGRLEEVIARNNETGEQYSWTPAGAFVYIGLTPNSQMLPDEVERDEWGFVTTDGHFQTSIAGVFVAGDVRAGSTKQLGAAVGDGIAALLMVRRYLEEHAHLSTTSVNA